MNSSLNQKNKSSLTSDTISQKTLASLVTYVYEQTGIALAASLFCAGIIFTGLYSFPIGDNKALLSWITFYLLVTCLRLYLLEMYKRRKVGDTKITTWRNL